MIRRRLRIAGRVQGVCFRDWMVAEARALGIAGWVRNRADGSVEALVEGGREAVDSLVAKARQGPPAARVDSVEVTEAADDQPLDGFGKRPTA